MDKFERGSIEFDPKKRAEMIEENVAKFGDKMSREQIEATVDDIWNDEIFVNSKYQVNKRAVPAEPNGFPALIWLSIKRRDKEPVHDWRDLQEIKDALVGAENEGFELYPAESRKVDTANQYHLWVFADPKVRLPVGFKERLVDYHNGKYSKQRGKGK